MKWYTNLVAAVAAVAVSCSLAVAEGAETNGVAMPDTIQVEGKTLALNGLGVRTKTLFRIKVYVAGLYVEQLSNRAEEIIAAEGARRVVLQMTHKAPKPRLVAEILDGFERSAGSRMSALQERLDALLAALPDLNEGQGISLTYVPGKGTTLVAAGSQRITIAGKDFADALLGVWVGREPLDTDLKRRLLGGK